MIVMSQYARGFILFLFNHMFAEFIFPASWCDTLVIFLPKPGSSKFCPISLTSTLCETFERRVQRRLKFLVERNRWLPTNQFGFRRGRSSVDCVAWVIADVL